MSQEIAMQIVQDTPAQPQNQLMQIVQDMSFVDRLTPETVRNTLAQGNEAVTDQEITLFVEHCKAFGLNPFIGDAWIIKYKSDYGKPKASIITAKAAMDKRADAHPMMDGIRSGVVVKVSDEVKRRPGALVEPGEALIGAWAEVHRKDRAIPIYAEASLSEYSTDKSTWESKPATMNVKVAENAALRRAFPCELGGMYSREEMDQVIDPQDPPQVAQEPVIMATEQQISDYAFILSQSSLTEEQVQHRVDAFKSHTESEAKELLGKAQKALEAAQAKADAVRREDLQSAEDIPF